MREVLLDLLQQFGICCLSELSLMDKHFPDSRRLLTQTRHRNSNSEEVTASTKRLRGCKQPTTRLGAAYPDHSNFRSDVVCVFRDSKAAGMRAPTALPSSPKPCRALDTPLYTAAAGCRDCLGGWPRREKILRGSGYICVQNWSYREFRPMLLSGDATEGAAERLLCFP
jgi:hypothetical protein